MKISFLDLINTSYKCCYDKTDISEGIDPAKSNNSKECMICHYWFLNYEFKFQEYVCNDCCNLTMSRLNISDIAIITVKGIHYRCIIHDINKSEVINLLENYVLDDCGYI